MKANKQPIHIIKRIANRLRDLDWANQILLDPENRNRDPIFPIHVNREWNDYRLLGDYPGILIFLSELDGLFRNENWDAAIHSYVLKMKEILENKGLFSLSLFGGVAGMAFALQTASRGGSRYQKMLASLNTHIIKLIDESYFLPLENNLRTDQPSPMALYDVIQGITGIGIYCLSNKQDAFLSLTAKKIVEYLVRLSSPLNLEGRTIPGWYVPASLQFLKEDKDKYPQGNFNLGLAHGIPGVLAFLSIALLRGIEVMGQKEAIEVIAAWIKKHRHEHDRSFFWGTHIPFEVEMKKSADTVFSITKKNGWCYGRTGVARSLFLAGKALHCEQLKSYATDSFCSIFRQSRHEWQLPSPSFCHGISGLLMTTWKMYQDTHSSFLKNQVTNLQEILLEYYREDFPFGFKNLETSRQGGFAEINQLSLLEGASGILLTLLSLEGLSSWWHAPFLIGED